MKIKNRYILWEGAEHQVTSVEWGKYVRKTPMTEEIATRNQAKLENCISFYRNTFPDFIPPTKVVHWKEPPGYTIIQKKVEWTQLSLMSEQDISQKALEELLKLVNQYQGIYTKGLIELDILWYQWEKTEDFKKAYQLYLEASTKSFVFPSWIRHLYQAYNTLYFAYKRFQLESNLLSSSNIIVGKDGKISFVDNIGFVKEASTNNSPRVFMEKIYRSLVIFIYKMQIRKLQTKKK